MTEELYEMYTAILTEELIPAMGCTEPIALAYAAARAREVLGAEPDHILARCSGNMIKNVRCVQIPNSGGMTGIEAAVCLGAFGGDAARRMEVLESVTGPDRQRAADFIAAGHCGVEFLDSEIPLHFIVELSCGTDTVAVEVRYAHTNIVSILKNGQSVFSGGEGQQGVHTDRSKLTIDSIKEYADTVPLEKISRIFERQIRCNMDIAYEGMSGNYGVGIGRMLRTAYPDSTFTRMRAYAAAASEARMAGCDMPVIINSGSGNQGIASSVPVIVYAREHFLPTEKLYRALAFSGLLTVHQKESASSAPSAGRSRPPARRARPSPTWWAVPWTRSRIPSTTPWPISPASSATAPKPAVRPKSPPAWMPPCWPTTWPWPERATAPTTASCGKTPTRPSAVSAASARKACGRPTGRSSI